MNRWGLEFEPIGRDGCEVKRLSDGVNLYYHPLTDKWWIVDVERIVDTPNMGGFNETVLRVWLNERAKEQK